MQESSTQIAQDTGEASQGLQEMTAGFFDQVLFHLFKSPVTIKNVLLLATVLLVSKFLLKLYRVFVSKTLNNQEWFDAEWSDLAYKIGRILIIVLAVFLIFYSLDLKDVWSGFLNYELIQEHEEGGFSLKVYNVFLFAFILFIGRMLVRLITNIVRNNLNNNPKLDKGQVFTIAKIVKYSGLLITFIIAVNGAGFNLTALLFGSAALLIAVGLGVQHIFDDVISGLILLFEGTFQVGDVIEVGGLIAQVKHIDIRTSKLLTREGIVVVVPNRKLSSDNINNWSHGNILTRFEIEVGVAYGSDVKLVTELLKKVAMNHDDVSKSKPILVQFGNFGESALEFKLRFWAHRVWEVEELQSELRFAIYDSFHKHQIRIPYPQRDIHVVTGEKLTY